jgi:hypothetical protein
MSCASAPIPDTVLPSPGTATPASNATSSNVPFPGYETGGGHLVICHKQIQMRVAVKSATTAPMPFPACFAILEASLMSVKVPLPLLRKRLRLGLR